MSAITVVLSLIFNHHMVVVSLIFDHVTVVFTLIFNLIMVKVGKTGGTMKRLTDYHHMRLFHWRLLNKEKPCIGYVKLNNAS